VPWDLGGPAVREALFGQVPIEEIEPAIRMLGDVPALLERMLSAGLRVALVTNNPTAIAEQTLEAMGVAGVMDGVYGSDLVRVGKPAPDLGLYACSALGVKPGAAAMVGDGHTDAAMARAAGIPWVVGVALDAEFSAELEPYVDAVVSSVDEPDAAA
jgi:phosphoglycolate phosphatase